MCNRVVGHGFGVAVGDCADRGLRVRLIIIAGRSPPPNRESTFEMSWSLVRSRRRVRILPPDLAVPGPCGQSSIAW